MAKQYSLYQYVVWSLHGLSAYVILTDSSSESRTPAPLIKKAGGGRGVGERWYSSCEHVFYFNCFY